MILERILMSKKTPKETLPPPQVEELKVQVVERLAENDKTMLETAKLKRELGVERAKTALAQSESSELTYNNVILQLALKYGLNNGDILNEDGTITRKTNQ
jgi:regulator of replication initiation timing